MIIECPRCAELHAETERLRDELDALTIRVYDSDPDLLKALPPLPHKANGTRLNRREMLALARVIVLADMPAGTLTMATPKIEAGVLDVVKVTGIETTGES